MAYAFAEFNMLEKGDNNLDGSSLLILFCMGFFLLKMIVTFTLRLFLGVSTRLSQPSNWTSVLRSRKKILTLLKFHLNTINR